MLLAGALLALGIGAALIADRVRVPGLLLFLGLGMLVGSEGIGGVEFDDAELTRTLGTIGLVLILFEGGLSAGWKEIRPVLPTAISLGTLGTILTALIAGFASAWILGLTTLEGMILGSAIAATDSAAIFAVLRGSKLRRKIARSLEGESGMNDPVALLLVTGFIAWIEEPGYGLPDMVGELVLKLGIGAVLGVAIGIAARGTFRRLDYPTQGLYPVASIATAGIAYGLTEVLHGSGFLAVYLTALALGTGAVPGKRTIVAFHQGLGWVSQISLFFLLGLLVFPSRLLDVAGEALLISALLIFVARPLAALVASLVARFSLRERLMLGWAGLRGAIPIWLATFPVIAGLDTGGEIFNIIFFVVVTSTLIQGVSFEPLARRLRLTSAESAIPRPLVESGTIRRLGGEVFAYRVDEDAAIVGRPVRDLRLPREAIVNVIVRSREAIPPRGSTEIEGGDELHVLVKAAARPEVEELMRRWREGPLDEAPRPRLQPRGSPQIFNVRSWRDEDGDPGRPERIAGIEITQRLRTRRDSPGALVLLADGRYAVSGETLVAVGGRRQVADWASRRFTAAEGGGARAWWQEVAGVLNAPAAPRPPSV
ncbi:MAG: potassium/proton antiporter [Actinobacteria bacterium]|nr:potassium/proton antiporter [Actinomycetota bacterium]